MSKKIITVALLLLAIVVVLAACKKEPEYELDYTVTLDNGDVIEIFKDEDGENFVTNVDGDQIPVTTDVDGFHDDVEDLITATTTPNDEKTTNKTTTSTTEKQTSSTTSTTTPVDNDETSTEKPTNNEKPTENTTESTTEQEIQLGSGSSDSSIDADDIVDLGGN